MTIDWEVQVSGFLPPPFEMIGACCEKTEGIIKPLAVHVMITDDATIRDYNRIYREKDLSTDVLSFPSINYPVGKRLGRCPELLKAEYDPDLSASMIGDIIISYDHAKAQALEYGHSLNRELCYLFAHGVFHLMGYDHMQEEEKKEMRDQEEKALSMAGVTRDAENMNMDENALLELARKALENSYSPYSHYAVGAALHCVDGRVFLGCNIENASLGLSNCAERTALFKAVSEGARQFDAIAIASSGSMPYPCGACRQALNEFAPEIRVLVTDAEGHIDRTTLPALLPHSFGPNNL